MKTFNKFMVVVLGVIAIWIQSATSDDVVINAEWVQLGAEVFTAIGVFLAANFSKAAGLWHYTKALVAGVGVLFTAWLGYLANGDHLTTSMWWNVVIAAVTAVFVFLVPKDPTTEVT